MEIFIHCGCGSPLLFNEEPVGGRVRQAVKCPNCGKDCTEQANEFIAAKLRGEEPSAKKPGFKLFGAKSASATAEELRDTGKKKKREDDDAPKPRKGSFALGAFVAVAAGVAGTLAWYYTAKLTGYQFGIMAWGIGALIGWGCRQCVPNGSFGLAGVAGLSAMLSIAGGHYLVMKFSTDELIKVGVKKAYQESMLYAKSGANLKTDAEIKGFLAQFGVKIDRELKKSAPNDKLSPTQRRQLYFMSWVLFGIMERDKKAPGIADIAGMGRAEEYSDKDVAAFREEEQPELKLFIEGKPTPAEFEATLKEAIYARITDRALLTASLTPYTVAWLVLGIASAFKLAHNRSEMEDM